MAARLGVSEVQIDGQNVTINWTDGHVCEFTATYLRLNCSCAECVEEWTNRPLLDPASVPADLKAEDYLPVGRYALQFLWSDAHYTGIYPFEALRQLCRGRAKSARKAEPSPLFSRGGHHPDRATATWKS